MKKLLWVILTTFTLLYLDTSPASDIFWTNIAGGAWSSAPNWSPNQVPTTNDTVWITNNGTYSVTISANAGATNLTLGGTSGTQTLNHAAGILTLANGGSSSVNGTYALSGTATLTGGGSLALAGPLNWTAGTVGSQASNLVVAANGGLNISGSSGTKTLNGGLLINGGAGSWTGAQIFLNTGIFSNAPGATFDLQADGATFTINGGGALVVNSGSFRKTSGAGVNTFTIAFNNGGLVDIQTGALSLNSGGTNTGQFTCSSSTAGLRFNGGIYALLDSSSITGPGSVSSQSGTVNLQGSVAVGAWTNNTSLNFNTLTTAYITNLTVTANIFNASNAIVIPGMFAWTGGTIGSAGSILTLLANGGITLNGGSRNLNGGTIINSSNAVWTVGALTCNNTAVFSNAPNALFDLQADGSAVILNSGTPLFANGGTIRKTSGSGTSTIGIPCNNSALVEVESGTLNLNAGGTNSGQFTIAAGAVLSFGAGTHLLQSGSTLSGSGAVSVGTGIVNVQGTMNVNSLTNGGTLNFNELAAVYPTNVTMNSGTLSGSNTVVVGGSFVWNGGNLGAANSSFSLVANGAMTINSGPTKNLQGGTLINAGAGAWIAGQVSCNNTPVFSNAPGATLELQGDGASFIYNSGTALFANAGIVRKTAGTGTNTFTMPCANSGSIEINSGTLALTLSDSSGTFSSAAGATLQGSGTSTLSPAGGIGGVGNFTFLTGALTNHGTFNVAGTTMFSGGTVRLDGTCTINNSPLIINGGNVLFAGSGSVVPSSLSLSSGTLQGTMPITISGPFSWTGGIVGAAGSSLSVFANGGMTLSGATKSFNGGTLVNNSAGSWTGGQIVCNNAGVFSNAPSGTFDLKTNGSSFAFNSGTSVFVNAGLLRKTGIGTNTVTMAFANFGSVQVNSGVLVLTLSDGTGSFAVAAGTTLSVNGTATLAPAASVSGAGNFELTTGALTNHGTMNVAGTNSFLNGVARLDGSVTIANTPLVMSGATVVLSGSGAITPSSFNFTGGQLSGTMPITVIGPMLWTSGTLATTGLVTASGGLTLSGSGKNLNGTLVNNGAGTWTNGQIACNSSTFSNTASATLDVLADGSAFAQNSGTSSIVNEGTLRKTGGTGTTSFTIPFINSGTVQVNTGALSFAGFTQTGGQTVMNGGNYSFSQTAQLRAGSLSGNGTVTGSISNNATVSPGASPGLLTITGNYTEGAGSHLRIELGGTTAGVTYDQLSVGGSAKLAGTLDISYSNGFIPSPGNVFTALVSNARSGGFSVVNAPTNTLSTVYTAKTVLIEPGNASPTARLAVDQIQTACHTFVIQGSGTDPDGTVTNVTLLQDTNVLASVAGSSAQIAFSSDFPGDLTFTAITTDDKGASGATNVTVSITNLPLLTLDAVGFQTNRAFKLCMTGEAGANYEIQANTNLTGTNWVVLGTMTNTNGIWRFSDVTASNASFRAYRARQLP